MAMPGSEPQRGPLAAPSSATDAASSAPELDELRERSLGELMKRLSRDISTLVRKELELARAELGQKGRQAGLGAGLFGGGAVVGLMAAFAFTAFLIALLALALPVWASALIVAAILGTIAAILAMQGKERFKEAAPPVPEQTVETLKEDVQWLKNPRQSAQK